MNFKESLEQKKMLLDIFTKDKDNYILIGKMYQHINIWIGLGVHECKNELTQTLQ